MGHLTREELVGLAERARPESSVPHLSTCEGCRSELRELRAVLDAVAGVDVPEPSPLFWDHLAVRISEAVKAEAATEPARESWWAPVRRWRWQMTAATVAAVVAVAAVLNLNTTPQVVPGSVLSTGSGSGGRGSSSGSVVQDAEPAPGVVELTDPADDPSLSLLADLTEDLDWETASEAGISVGAGAAEWLAADLDEAERAELHRLLNDALAGTPVGSTSGPIESGTAQTL